MDQMVCTDALGKSHDVPLSDIAARTFEYGIHIVNNTVLMVFENSSQKWRFPGGELGTLENKLEGMRRGVYVETGIIASPDVKLTQIQEEDFYDIVTNVGYVATRLYYQLMRIEGGELKVNGDGGDIVKAEYIDVEKVRHFSEKKIRMKTAEVLVKMLGAK